MQPHSALPRALRANALASLVTGLAGLLMSAPLAQTFTIVSGQSLQLFGGVLVLHALLLLWATGRRAIGWWTRVNLAGLAIYVLVLAMLLALGKIPTSLGQILLAADAVLVVALALWQLRALTIDAPRPAL